MQLSGRQRGASRWCPMAGLALLAKLQAKAAAAGMLSWTLGKLKPLQLPSFELSRV